MRTIELILDDLDYESVKRIIAMRERLGTMPETAIHEDVDGREDGRAIAEICRGWEEFMGESEKPDREEYRRLIVEVSDERNVALLDEIEELKEKVVELDGVATGCLARCRATDMLIEALEDAVRCIRLWRGELAWDLYQNSPEMKRIHAALAAARVPEETNAQE